MLDSTSPRSIHLLTRVRGERRSLEGKVRLDDLKRYVDGSAVRVKLVIVEEEGDEEEQISSTRIRLFSSTARGLDKSNYLPSGGSA